VLDDQTSRDITDLAVLGDALRRRVYEYVSGQPASVSRDETASALGIGRSLAAHHLDRLAAANLLDVEYARRSGRSGPGAGRPAKLYRIAAREVAAHLPQRRYEVAADLFATALASDASGRDALAEAAQRQGEELGAEARRRAGPRANAQKRLESLTSVLRDAGYLPVRRGDEIRLLNCPFHELAQRHREVTCSMNEALLQGTLASAGLLGGAAHLDPQPGMCCVAIDTHELIG
jgi:predicted ArsR family transcriptional regulator